VLAISRDLQATFLPTSRPQDGNLSIHRRIAAPQRLTATGERSGFRTHIGTTESISLCVRMKNSLRLWNLNRRRDIAAHRGASEVKLKLVYGKNSNWLLFNPNQLQKFPQ
jgi:hypothetical protein